MWYTLNKQVLLIAYYISVGDWIYRGRILLVSDLYRSRIHVTGIQLSRVNTVKYCNSDPIYNEFTLIAKSLSFPKS